MSKILNEITTNSISLSECLQRLLVIANKTDNRDLANWCLKELNGYKAMMICLIIEKGNLDIFYTLELTDVFK